MFKLSLFLKISQFSLIPASAKAYQNIDQINIQSKVLLISCGKKSVKASIYLKKKFKGLVFNIHIQDPKSNHNLFDLIISPEHDQLKKPNNISTLLALHNINFDLNKKKRLIQLILSLEVLTNILNSMKIHKIKY